MALPTEMKLIAMDGAGAPEVMRARDRSAARVEARRSADPRPRRRREPARYRATSGLLSAAARRIAFAWPGGRRRDCRHGRGGRRLAYRRSGLRVGQRRRLRRILRRSGDAMSALAQRLRRGARRGTAGNVLHRLG